MFQEALLFSLFRKVSLTAELLSVPHRKNNGAHIYTKEEHSTLLDRRPAVVPSTF